MQPQSLKPVVLEEINYGVGLQNPNAWWSLRQHTKEQQQSPAQYNTMPDKGHQRSQWPPVTSCQYLTDTFDSMNGVIPFCLIFFFFFLVSDSTSECRCFGLPFDCPRVYLGLVLTYPQILWLGLDYFQDNWDNWIEGNYPCCMWNKPLDGPAPTTTLEVALKGS